MRIHLWLERSWLFEIRSNVKQKSPRCLLVLSEFWFSRSQTASEASTWATVYLNLNKHIYVLYVFRFQNHFVFLHVFWCSEELPSWNHRSISRWPGLPSRPRGWSGCCECWRLKFGSQNISSWRFQPSWKTLVKLDHFPKDRGEHKKSLKLPPRS